MGTNTPKARFWAIPSAAVLILGSWLATNEGDSQKAYWDQIGRAWTICRGMTGPDVVQGLTLTADQCRAREAAYIRKQSARIGYLLKVPLSVEEWVAWGDFSYNLGVGRFAQSKALTLLNQGKRHEACAEILKWRFAGGLDCSLPENKRICGGIWTRRLRERNYCDMGAGE